MLSVVAQCVALGGLKKSVLPDWWKQDRPQTADEVRGVARAAQARQGTFGGR